MAKMYDSNRDANDALSDLGMGECVIIRGQYFRVSRGAFGIKSFKRITPEECLDIQPVGDRKFTNSHTRKSAQSEIYAED